MERRVKNGTRVLSKQIFPSLSIAGFLAWWGQGLRMCLPARVQRLFWHEATYRVLEPRGKGVQVYRERGESCEDLGVYEGVGYWTDSLISEDETLVLRLPSTQVLSKRMTLPAAAEENLRQVLAFEMERHTPFNVNHVYYDFEIIERNPKARHLLIKLVVVPRRILREWLERLSSWGLHPAVVSVANDEPHSINLLPEEERPSRPKGLPRLNVVLTGLLLVLIAGVVFLPLWQKRTIVIDLMAKVATEQRQAEVVLALRQRVDKAIKASNFLVNKKLEFPTTVELLYELTRLLPDGTWLQRLSITRSELDIRGESTEASSLISRLEASPYFENVQFSSPITTNGRTGRDRFHITAQLPKLKRPPL